MNAKYDVVVVGGGPGGSWAAKYAAENGMSVLMLEKDREIGVPVRCAEGVSEKGLKVVVELRDEWVAQVITGGCLVAPNGKKVFSYPDERGYILHRKLFDYDLAKMAGEAGAEVVTKAYVSSLLKEEGVVKGVEVQHLGKTYEIGASVVIAADGVESRVGRWAGLKTDIAPTEMASCVQMTLGNIDIDHEVVSFFFGKDVAPGGYCWIFPKGPGVANVGLGVAGKPKSKENALFYLNRFVEKNFPNAATLTMVAGGVPNVETLKKITTDGFMLVGDAARQANPVSGGGIVNAMVAGRIAGRVAAEAIQEGNVSDKRLSVYAKEWDKAEGKNNARSYKIKQTVHKLTDEDLNKAADALLKLPEEKRTAFNVFKTVLFNHPKLILEAAKIFV